MGNAHLKNDLQCSCTSNSLYNSESMNCTCDAGYTEANSFCIKYGNYFAPSEISASYSADYKSFVLTFARQVSDSTVLNCAGEVSLPRVLASLQPLCSWTSYTTLVFYFASAVQGDPVLITIDPQLVQAMEANAC